MKRYKDQEDRVTSSRTGTAISARPSHWLLDPSRAVELILSLIRDYLIYLTTNLISVPNTRLQFLSFFHPSLLGLKTTQGLEEHAKLPSGESRLLSSER